jgi:hypothetical protein
MWGGGGREGGNSITEAEFLDVIGTKVLRVFLLAIESPTTSCLKLLCNVNIVYGNLKSENS